MKPESATPEVAETTDEPSQEHVIRGPHGFRVVAESTADELVAGLGPRDRIHVVVVHDPVIGKDVGTITVVRGTVLDEVDSICGQIDEPFHAAIRKAAYAQVCGTMWGGMPPEGADLRHAFEISQRELREIMQAEMDLRAHNARTAS